MNSIVLQQLWPEFTKHFPLKGIELGSRTGDIQRNCFDFVRKHYGGRNGGKYGLTLTEEAKRNIIAKDPSHAVPNLIKAQGLSIHIFATNDLIIKILNEKLEPKDPIIGAYIAFCSDDLFLDY